MFEIYSLFLFDVAQATSTLRASFRTHLLVGLYYLMEAKRISCSRRQLPTTWPRRNAWKKERELQWYVGQPGRIRYTKLFEEAALNDLNGKPIRSFADVFHIMSAG